MYVHNSKTSEILYTENTQSADFVYAILYMYNTSSTFTPSSEINILKHSEKNLGVQRNILQTFMNPASLMTPQRMQ